jgi:hypothetical protein
MKDWEVTGFGPQNRKKGSACDSEP